MSLKFAALLMIALLALAVFAQEESPIPITGETIQGEISTNNVSDRYSIELVAGEQLTVNMAALDNNLDSRLFLFDAVGNPLANDDDSGGQRDARIVYTATTTGLYIIEATRFQAEGGGTVGAYELTISRNNNPNNPLSFPPRFAVGFAEIVYEQSLGADLSPNSRQSYFVIGSQQGDFVRIELNTVAGDLNADVQLFNEDLQIVSRVSQSSPNQKVIFAAIPETAWYLIAVTQQSGTGTFTIVPSLVADTLLNENTLAEGSFDDGNDTHFFVLNAAINERVFVNLAVKEGQNIRTLLTIEDLNRNQLDSSESAGTQSRVSITVPRSGPYIVQVQNIGTGSSGAFQLQLRRVPVDVNKLRVTDVEYNEPIAEGFVSQNSPIRYYRFSGKAGERVNIRMSATGPGNLLDPYLILADTGFNELVFNDNVSASLDAQISQYLLPADGDYYILASRQGLAGGTTVGSYAVELTVGEIKLETGRLTATLRWEGDADLNLFVRTPDNHTISWANQSDANGGQMQINSNTACETLTDQPVEHIYWPADLLTGDYTIWVWYQATCRTSNPVNFTLTIAVDGQDILQRSTSTRPDLVLQPFQRFEAVIRIPAADSPIIVNDGFITNPSPQQTESQGGDTLMGSAPQTGEINDTVFAQFYQFQGNEGERIRITVESITGNLDPILFLRDATDQALAENDDISPDDSNAQLEYVLPTTGIYVIVVSRYGLRDGTSFGDYRLSLERLENN